MAFGVDNGEPERVVYEAASVKSIPTTMASDITKLYGLTRRTRTAAINASILPKMLDTATSTEDSVREAGVNVSLMIMRGDGGVMEINEMKTTCFNHASGPAASVMGSLMYLRASNGVYFEVGGTTTNIGSLKWTSSNRLFNCRWPPNIYLFIRCSGSRCGRRFDGTG